MRKSLAVLLVAAACGGKQTPKEPPPPLPEPKVEEAKKPDEPAQPEEPKEPPVPQGPIELTLPSPKTTVKLVSAGKGAKKPLKLTPRAGLKQQIEVALDFTGGQEAPPELGGKKDEVSPTVVLAADVETQEVGADGQAKFQLTISGVDAKDMAGSKMTGAEFKQEIQSLAGATIAGSVGADGASSDLTLRVEKPDAKTPGAMELIKVTLLPLWPVLPAEAVAPGAKWTVTSIQKIADQLEVTRVVSYELVGKKGTAWTIKGTTKISGTDQDVQGAKIGAIGGGGTTEHTVNDGTLVPSTKQTQKTEFTITATAPPMKEGETPKSVNVKFHLDQTNALTLK
jgi:hypothetical protein